METNLIYSKVSDLVDNATHGHKHLIVEQPFSQKLLSLSQMPVVVNYFFFFFAIATIFQKDVSQFKDEEKKVKYCRKPVANDRLKSERTRQQSHELKIKRRRKKNVSEDTK